MNIKRAILLFVATLLIAPVNGQQIDNKSWSSVALEMPDGWYSTPRAAEVADNVLLYQREAGGWPKNIEIHHRLTDEQREQVVSDKSKQDAILDNDATTTELHLLAKVYNFSHDARLKEAFKRGFDFIIEAQYGDDYKGVGGWPMFYPLKGHGYYDRVTFNDNAVSNILILLKEVYQKSPEFLSITDAKMRRAAKKSYDLGIGCILNCQIVKQGRRTVWCAQHDEHTLLPAYGRPYEHPSFSGGESVGLVRVLMNVDRPSKEVIEAVIAAVGWLDEHRIKDSSVENFVNADGERDRRIVATPGKDMWARFYDLNTYAPMFGDYVDPPVVVYDYYAITRGRRAGYNFFVTLPQQLIDEDYPNWLTKHKINPDHYAR